MMSNDRISHTTRSLPTRSKSRKYIFCPLNLQKRTYDGIVRKQNRVSCNVHVRTDWYIVIAGQKVRWEGFVDLNNNCILTYT